MPVQAYIETMPGWKSDIGRRIDALIVRVPPEVRKAVRWNTTFFGVEDQGWFLGIYCYKKYVQLSFLNGASLKPLPSKSSEVEGVRYLNILEDDELDEKQLACWIKQATRIPGNELF